MNSISYAVSEHEKCETSTKAKDTGSSVRHGDSPGEQSKTGNRGLNNNNVFRLTDREKSILSDALAQINYDDSGNSIYINTVKNVALSVLPKRVLAALQEQKASLRPCPYLVFDNMPTDDEVFGAPTSLETGSLHKSGHISEN